MTVILDDIFGYNIMGWFSFDKIFPTLLNWPAIQCRGLLPVYHRPLLQRVAYSVIAAFSLHITT